MNLDDIVEGRKTTGEIRATDITDALWRAMTGRSSEGLSEDRKQAIALAQVKRLRKREGNKLHAAKMRIGKARADLGRR
jgi:hypothetical protein